MTNATISHEKHLSQAIKNKELSEKLLESDPPVYDWAVTVSYYSAVHFLDYYLKRFQPTLYYYELGVFSGIRSLEHFARETECEEMERHTLRKQIVDSNFQQLSRAWKFLMENSDSARYWCQDTKPQTARQAIIYINSIQEVLGKPEP
jgi:hypothetical protein